MVEFDNSNDKVRVLQDGPRHFDKALLLTKAFDGEKQVKDIQLREVAFWVRIHDLPLMARNELIGREIGKTLGSIEEVDLDVGKYEWGEFMHIQVSIDAIRPLI